MSLAVSEDGYPVLHLIFFRQQQQQHGKLIDGPPLMPLLTQQDNSPLTLPSPSPATHDTSRSTYHISEIASFAENLQDV